MSIDIQQKIIIKWSNKNKLHLIEKGYKFTRYGEELTVKINDLNLNSTIKVPCTCDYCNAEIFKKYVDVNPYRNVKYKSELKISCKKCSSKKQKDICNDRGIGWTSNVPSFREKYIETWNKKYRGTKEGELIKEKTKNTMLERYGVEYAAQNKNIYQKVIETNIKKYGVKYTFQNNEIKEKSKQTMIKKYGVEYAACSKEIYNKIIETNLQKYDVKYVTQSDNMKQKCKQTFVKRYGFIHSSQHPEIKKKTIISMKKSIYENGTGVCSKQQKHIYNLIGGKLNYPVEYYNLDIAFPNENIYVEYDGGGHELCVKLGKISKDEFDKLQWRRYNCLRDNNWKMIRIVSSKDLLPSDTKLLSLINYCKNYLINNNNNWIEINIDNSYIKCSKYVIYIDLKDLKYIK